VRASYNRASQEIEELFSARIDGKTDGLYYRITRDDRAFDSGLKNLTARIVEDLPLQREAFNIFSFRIFDSANNSVPADFETIEIAQGKYSVAGQPLPEDILPGERRSRAQRYAPGEDLQPKPIVARGKERGPSEVSHTIPKGSDGEIRIMVVEGSSENHSTTNKWIGTLIITGSQLKRDLVKGTTIDLSFEMSESRDLKCPPTLDSTEQEFSKVFNPQNREVIVPVLAAHAANLQTRFAAEVTEAQENDRREVRKRVAQDRAGYRKLSG